MKLAKIGILTVSSMIIMTSTAFASTGNITSVLSNAAAGSTVTLTGSCTGDSKIYMSKNGVTVNSSGATLNGSSLLISGSNNKINYLTITNSPTVGMWLYNGASGNVITGCEVRAASNMGYATMYSGTKGNTFDNCKAKYCYDSAGNGGDADGFGNKFSAGAQTWKSCYAYNNSDDGWDAWNSGSGTNVLTNCTAERNGYKKDGTTTSAMNGCGFKLGGPSATSSWKLTGCIAKNNKTYAFKRNGTTGTITLSGCTNTGNPNGIAIGSGN
jgi:hypothetical protein